MRDPARIERIMDKLETCWKAAPDTRFTQLLNWFLDGTIEFHQEDDITESKLDNMALKLLKLDFNDDKNS